MSQARMPREALTVREVREERMPLVREETTDPAPKEMTTWQMCLTMKCLWMRDPKIW